MTVPVDATMNTVMDAEMTARTNPGVEPQKIEQAMVHRRIIEKAGLLKKPTYGISPPLGGAAEEPATGSPRVIRMSK